MITDQWHVNGVLRFVDQHGRRLLAFTHRIHAEAVVLNDPWSSPGTRILQRFGTPTRYDTFGSVAGRHFFGVTSEGEGDGGLQGGVHNLWYTAHPNGRDTLTIFCNSLKPSGPSKVYEFDLLGPLATEGGNAYAQPPSDRPQAFSTPYVRANLDFQADAEGGARVLSDGVYLVSGGLLSNLTGFEVVDLHGRVYRIPYVEPRGQGKNLMGFYDPFTYLDLPPGQEPWVSSFPQFRGLDDGGSGLVSTS